MEADEVIALCGQVEKWKINCEFARNPRSCPYVDIEGRVGDIDVKTRCLIRPREPYRIMRIHITAYREGKEIGELARDYAPGVTPYFEGPFFAQVALAIHSSYQLEYIATL